MRIRIEHELFLIQRTRGLGDGLFVIETEGGDFILAEDYEAAHQAVKARWRAMDAKELVCMVGEEQIVREWAAGNSFEDWLDGLDAEAELASYDGHERDVQRVGNLRAELGYTPTVAYRTH